MGGGTSQTEEAPPPFFHSSIPQPLPAPIAPPAARLRFASRFHPGDAPVALVYARALTEPLAWSLTGVMVAATASVLSEQDPLGWLLVVVPLICALATGYAAYALRRRPAELILEDGRGAVRSVWAVTTGWERPRLHPVFSRKRTREGLSVAIGRTLYTFAPEDWMDYDALEEAVYAAAARAAEQAAEQRRARAPG